MTKPTSRQPDNAASPDEKQPVEGGQQVFVRSPALYELFERARERAAEAVRRRQEDASDGDYDEEEFAEMPVWFDVIRSSEVPEGERS